MSGLFTAAIAAFVCVVAGVGLGVLDDNIRVGKSATLLGYVGNVLAGGGILTLVGICAAAAKAAG